MKGAFLSKTQKRKGKGQTNMTMGYREENKQNVINRTEPSSLFYWFCILLLISIFKLELLKQSSL